MAVTRERLEQGLTYDQFVAGMTKHRALLLQNEQAAVIDPADLAYFRGLPETLDVLVLAEDAPGDIAAGLSVLAKLARESGNLRLHLFRRDQDDDLMRQYLFQGQFRAIPVFVFFDQHMRELGHFIERPPAFNALQARQRQRLFAEHPEMGDPATPSNELSEAQRQTRQTLLAGLDAELAPERARLLVRDLRAIVETKPTVQ
ncbi:MAG TPA: thioredoxin family protein [Chloroflexota bacterium]|jgi:hypothetical protein